MERSPVLKRPRPQAVAPAAKTIETYPTQAFLQELLASSLLLAEDWEGLDASDRTHLARCHDRHDLLDQLVAHSLLTQYQRDRISSDKTFGLVLGNYRVLDRLGAGGMGVVFR